MFGKNFFGGMFDFNRDGKTDAIERAIGYQALEEMERENEEELEEELEELDEDDLWG